MRALHTLTTAVLASLLLASAGHAATAAEIEAQAMAYEGVAHLVPQQAARRSNALAERQAAVPTSAPTPERTRAAVVAELARARAAGEMDFVAAELGQVSAPVGPITRSRLARR
ncbi:hypothetical protein [Inhella sp.]|uniref:hypothetical protein n=1 Tax=Inhella sp. TaxID=1921806 RepID=UPI0035B183BA